MTASTLLSSLIIPARWVFGTLFAYTALQAQSPVYTTPYTITTLAGTAGTHGYADGTGAAAQFEGGYGMATVGAATSSIYSDNVYLIENAHGVIRVISSAGGVTTLAGALNNAGYADGTGSAARFNNPLGVAADASGNVYVADATNNVIRKVTAAGVVTTLAGMAGSSGSVDGTGSAARFNNPNGVAVDSTGNVLVADSSNHALRKITPAGVVTTLAGSAGTTGSTDGTGSVARFSFFAGIATDAADNIYVADYQNRTIRKVTPAGVVTTLAGLAGNVGYVDATGSAARFGSPYYLAADSAGNLFVTEQGTTVRRITPAGVVSTIAGTPINAGSADGTGSVARFNQPLGVAVNRAGVVYVYDSQNFTVRQGVAPAPTNDNFASATVIASAGGTVTGTSAGATREAGEPTVSGPGGQSVWWKWTAPASATYSISTAGTTFDTVLGVYVGSTVGALAVVGSNDNADIANNVRTSKVLLNAVASTTYYIQVDGYKHSGQPIYAGDIVLTIGLSAPFVSGDLNGDGKSDLVLSNGVTGERAVWLMNGPAIASGASLGVLPTNFVFSASGDFNGDGKSDIFLTDVSSGDRAMWLMNGGVIASGASVGNLPTNWVIAGSGDFDGDGKSDLVLSNTSTGERVIWLMNGATISSGASLGVLPTSWVISQIGDFNGDGKADILLTNNSGGERVIWTMNGASIASGTSLGILSTNWWFAGAGDFNGDGKCDILLSNISTGERAIWLMNGTTIASGGSLGLLPVTWTVSRVGDFNGDGKADIFLTNSATGERVIWTMNGAAITSGASLGILATDWSFLGN